MPDYLTNTEPPKRLFNPCDHDTEEFRVYVASLRSGQNVRYLRCAMPDHWTAKSPACNGYACVVGFEDTRDYSRFWEEYDRLNDDDWERRMRLENAMRSAE